MTIISPVDEERSVAIKVELKVTGIYFGTANSLHPDFTVTVNDKPTVKQILNAAVVSVKAGGYKNCDVFAYTDNGKYLLTVSVNYTAPPAPGLAKSPYPPNAGFYSLHQVLNTPYDQALQYYHYRPTMVDNKKALIQLNITNAETPFVDPPTEEIKDGDVIVWRLVTIENEALRSARGFGGASQSANQLVASLNA